MAKISSYVIGGLAVAAVMIGALPAAQGIDAATKQAPTVQVNRAAKGNRIVAPETVAMKRIPSGTARETIPNPDPTSRPRIMDGCDPMFSPVTVPGMAHIAGRCVG
jgi:hypothetical protein